MKCIILAGGTGDRLWPLSRKNYPKQFLSPDGVSSVFQETIIRNMPFVKDFLIVANESYRMIVEGQLQQFQGLSYHIYLEEEGRGTAPAVAYLAHQFEKDEEFLVLPSDLIIRGENYSDAIYRAKELSAQGRIALFGTVPTTSTTAYGYILHRGTKVTRFIEKPTHELAERLFGEDNTLWNSGMMLTRGGLFLDELKKYSPHLYMDTLSAAGSVRKLDEHTTALEGSLFSKVEKMSVEKAVLEQSTLLDVVRLRCEWSDISGFHSYERMEGADKKDLVICSSSPDATVINTTDDRLLVVNDLPGAVVVSTPDAMYVSSGQKAADIKTIMRGNYEKYREFFDQSPVSYRPWGTRELIRREPGYRVRYLTIYPGMALSNHFHEKRSENYVVVSGVLTIELSDRTVQLSAGDGFNIQRGRMHRLLNLTDEIIHAIEVDTGSEITEQDMVYARRKSGEPKEPSILKLSPAYKDNLWGGNELISRYHKDSPYEITAESWELSAHPAGPSRISGGPYDGMLFDEYIRKTGVKSCGWKSQTFARFSILIKFIDAKKALSIQIHPDDDYAFVREGEFGKNEVWYVIDARPGSFLYCGLKKDTPKEEIAQRIADHSITDILNRVEVKAGDVIFIPAGTIHSIGAGILICEIQQSSNSTYRVWDFDRKDADGNLRPLHIEKALDVVDTSKYSFASYGCQPAEKHEQSTQQVICRCKYFETTKYVIDGEEIIKMDEASFKSIIVIRGNAALSCREETVQMHPGDSFFITAGRKRLHISGNCEILVTNI